MRMRFLYGSVVAGFFIGVLISIWVGDVLHIKKWDAGWIQAIGSICAVAVAIYVPWKIDKDKRQAEEQRIYQLRRLSLKALSHEVWTMRMFFINCIKAVDNKDLSKLSHLVREYVPEDSEKILAIDSEKFHVLLNIEDEITTFYFNAISRKLYATVYAGNYYFELIEPTGLDLNKHKIEAKRFCEEGLSYCNSILDKVSKEFGAISTDLEIKVSD